MGEDIEGLTQYQRTCEELARRRNEALSADDAISFCRLTNEGGFPLESQAEKRLYELGRADFLQKKKGIAGLEEKSSSQERDYWERIARIALARFPELEKGEHIFVVEIRKRLKELRATGCPIQPYSRMIAKEIWEYLSQIRRHVASEARKYCPDVLENINRKNERQKRGA